MFDLVFIVLLLFVFPVSLFVFDSIMNKK